MLIGNNFITLTYGLHRAGVDENLKNHIIFPITFILKQSGILIPFYYDFF